jgi:hypothetical protein
MNTNDTINTEEDILDIPAAAPTTPPPSLPSDEGDSTILDIPSPKEEDILDIPSPQADTKYGEYTHPELVKWLDESFPSVKKTGDVLNAIIDTTKEGAVKAAEYTQKEGPFKAAAQITARTGFMASEALATLPADIVSLGATGAIKIIDNMNPVDQMRYKEVRDSLYNTQRKAEFASGFLDDQLEEIYNKQDYLHPTDKEDQSVLNDISTLATLGAGAGAGVSKLGGVSNKVKEGASKVIQEVTNTTANVGKAAVGEFVFNPHSGTFSTVTDSSEDTKAEKRLRMTSENALMGEAMGVAIPLAKGATKAVDAISEPLKKATSEIVKDEAGSINLPGFLRGDFEGDGISDKVKAAKKVQSVMKGEADASSYTADRFEDYVLNGSAPYTEEGLSKLRNAKTLAESQVPILDQLGPVTPSAISESPQIQQAIGEHYGSKTRSPSGVVPQSFKASLVNSLHPLMELYSTTTGVKSRFYLGEGSQAFQLNFGGSASSMEGAITGHNNSQWMSIIDHNGIAKEVEGVNNLGARFMNGITNIGKTMEVPKEEAYGTLKKTLVINDAYDNFVNINKGIQEEIRSIAEVHGIDYEDLWNPRADIHADPDKGEIARTLSDMLGYGIPKSPNYNYRVNLEDPTHLAGVRKLFGDTKAVSKSMDEIERLAKLKPNGVSKTEVWDFVAQHQDSPWYTEFSEQTRKWNQVMLFDMYQAGRINKAQYEEMIANKPHYLPNFKEVENIGGPEKIIEPVTNPYRTMGTRDITEHEMIDSVEALVKYVKSQSTANTTSRVNNIFLRRILTDVNAGNFKYFFAQDYEAVMKAFNDSMNNTKSGSTSFSAFDLLPQAAKDPATHAKVVNVTGNVRFNINGNTIELTPLDGDMFALMRGLAMTRQHDDPLINTWKAVNQFASSLLIKLNPLLPAKVALKELVDTMYTSNMASFKDRVFSTSRLTSLKDIAVEVVSPDSKLVSQATKEYERQSGSYGFNQSIAWKDALFDKSSLFEAYVLSGGQSTKATAAGYHRLIRPIFERIQKFQMGWDSFIRSPEAKSLLDAGLNPEDAYAIASVGSAAFRAGGNGVLNAHNKRIVLDMLKNAKGPGDYFRATMMATRGTLLNSWIAQGIKETALSKAVLQSTDVYLNLITKEPMHVLKTTGVLASMYIGYELTTAGAGKTLERANSYDYQNRQNTHLTDEVLFHGGFIGQNAIAFKNFIVSGAGAIAKDVLEKAPKTLRESLRREDPELYQALIRSSGPTVFSHLIGDLYNIGAQYSSFGLGVGSTAAAVTGYSNEDAFGRVIVKPDLVDEPKESRQVGYNTNPMYVQAASYLSNTYGLEISPARAELLMEMSPIGNLLSSGIEAWVEKQGLIPEAPATKWKQYSSIKSFFDQNDLMPNQVHNARLFSVMSHVGTLATQDEYSDKELLSEGKLEATQYGVNRDNRSVGLSLNTYLTPYKDTIKTLYDQISLVQNGKVPGVVTPDEKRNTIDQLRSQIYFLKEEAVEGIYASFPQVADKLDAMALRDAHPYASDVVDFLMKNSTSTKKATIPPSAKTKTSPVLQEEQILDIKGTPFVYSAPAEDLATSFKALTAVLDIPDYKLRGSVLTASRLTGVSPDLLTMMMGIESTFGEGKNIYKDEGATGVFQFMKGTWEDGVKRHGKEYGITKDDINDPTAQAIMVAANIQDWTADYKNRFKENPSKEALYLYHYLGVSGAQDFLSVLKSDNPHIPVNMVLDAKVFKSPINQAYFGKNGENSVEESYRLIVQAINVKLKEHAKGAKIAYDKRQVQSQ